MESLRVRVSRSYSELSKVFDAWKERCEELYVVQHDADEEVTRDHCHCCLINVKVSTDTLKNDAKKFIQLSGNKDWSFKNCDVNRVEEYKVYMLKGKLEFVIGKSDGDDELRSKWTDKKIIKEKEEKYDEWTELKKSFNKYYEGMNKPRITLDGIRTWTMRWYWQRDGRVPPPTAYKRNAASLYVYATELANGSIDCAFEELKNLWY